MCKPRRTRTPFLILAAIAAAVAFRAPAAPADVDEEVVMIDERFTVAPGDRFVARVPDADVIVEQHTGREVRIEVILRAEDMDRARSYFATQRYRVERQGDAVQVTADPEQTSRWRLSWDRTGDAHIIVRATVPARFDLDVRTSDGDVVLAVHEGQMRVHTADGDIAAEALTGGPVELRTSDGDIRVGRIEAPGGGVDVRTSDGDISLDLVAADQHRIRTSDGDIAVGRLRGSGEIVTSDGSIRLASATGPVIDVRTSDGDIVIDELASDDARIRTSDGNVVLRATEGALEATTASGDLDVRLLKPGAVTLRANDGDILVTAPPGLPATLQLRGDEVRVDAAFAFRGRIEEDRAEGALNSGGPRLEAHSSDGTIYLRAQD